ncbi:DNA repair protein RadC [Opitutus sp. GAS368]|jgi:DNA repair protein RadC|uniref:RadC family protein n=1 Tax=Opitutus sp. GAS368 TaxID=1882749 RepID=UPI00087D36E9|nr:DNA repair protein RadC [Opitutus sp. GAS368]SDS67041.1 DNA repair protein RadC [Opitutus sp. GAS368]
MSDESYPPLRVRDLAVTDRPQERLERLGPAALSDTELLAMLLRSGSRGHNVISIAQRLIAEAGSLAALIKWNEADFRRLTGIGRVKALQLVTVMEIVRRGLAKGAEPEDEVLNRPELIHAHFKAQIAGLAVEKFWVLCLNRKNRLLKQVEVTSGTATSSLAHPREVFREAIRQGATAVVCVHNHPSGDPAPSAADVQVTRQLRDAAKAVDIELLDHVIVGRSGADPQGRGYYSFREAGVI